MWKVLNISDKNYKGEKMSKIKVGIVGYGTIGKRVADAVFFRMIWS